MTAKTDEAAWGAMRRNFDDRDIITLTAVAGFTNCSNRVAEALHFLPEPPGERIGFQPEDTANMNIPG
jgi:alkylhydroperoxidase family enzyme